MRLRAPLVAGLAFALVLPAAAEDPAAARQLIGLWSAWRHFGPRVSGPLTLMQNGQAWTAEIAGRRPPVNADKGLLTFGFTDGQGSFRGRVAPDGRVLGHWIQPRTNAFETAFATPVTLERLAPGRWRGAVAPLDDEMTLHMRILMGGQHGSGNVIAFLRNPERNAGRSLDVEEVVLDGQSVRLMGRSGKDAPSGELVAGRYAEGGTLSLYIPSAGGTFDFRRALSADEAGFYPRARTPASWTYVPPLPGRDGWPVGTLDEARLSRELIAEFVGKLVDLPIDDVHALEVHGLLVARRGKLVLEEYFHGFHRDALHDAAGASEVLASALPDPWRFGERIAGPLQMGRYALAVTSAGEPQMAGARLQPRDFLKLGQLVLDKGRWRGAPVVSADWARAATPSPADGKDALGGPQWRSTEFEYKRPREPKDAPVHKVQGFYAAGDGGQLLVVVPDLELVAAFLGGNYGQEESRFPLAVFVPGYILAAVN